MSGSRFSPEKKCSHGCHICINEDVISEKFKVEMASTDVTHSEICETINTYIHIFHFSLLEFLDTRF